MQPETMTFRERAYEGTVSHSRRYEISHRFQYRVWMSLTRLTDSRLPRLLRPDPRRYLDPSAVLAKFPRSLQAGAEVWLLTQPSLLGRSFNPVSFYIVAQGGDLTGIVAHITNTPWDETHCYVLERGQEDDWTFDKVFHVSPFMPMGLRYVWRFDLSDARLCVTMRLYEEEAHIFTAALNLSPAAPSRWLPLRLRLRYPCQNLLTLARIYWQAFQLKLKGARFHAHPDNTTAAPGTSR